MVKLKLGTSTVGSTCRVPNKASMTHSGADEPLRAEAAWVDRRASWGYFMDLLSGLERRDGLAGSILVLAIIARRENTQDNPQ